MADIATGAAMTLGPPVPRREPDQAGGRRGRDAAGARGDLFLDDTVEEWLPGLLPAGDRITVAELLSHTSGLAEYNRVPAAWPVLKRHPVDQHALVVAAGRAPPTFAPGQGQSYSNTNYAVLGMVVERVTGRPSRPSWTGRCSGRWGCAARRCAATGSTIRRSRTATPSGRTPPAGTSPGGGPPAAW